MKVALQGDRVLNILCKRMQSLTSTTNEDLLQEKKKTKKDDLANLYMQYRCKSKVSNVS